MNQKKLYRSRADRVIFGVCGGLGKYFDIDPVIFRILFVLLAFIDGVGILAYIIMAIVIPAEDKSGSDGGRKDEVDEFADKVEKRAEDLAGEIKKSAVYPSGNSKNALGIIIILAGLFLLAREFFPLEWVGRGIIFPLAVILLGFYIISKANKNERQ